MLIKNLVNPFIFSLLFPFIPFYCHSEAQSAE
jgi:hypothetical protein